MAIVLQPKYPIPDRSKQTIHSKKAEDGVIDIGWCEGVLSDGRTFRAEMWAQDQISMLTIFFSRVEFEEAGAATVAELVESQGLVEFRKAARKHYEVVKVNDDAGNPMWSVNVTVGGEDETYLENSVPIFPYSKIGEPNTMLNLVAIKAAHKER